jgi:hypothetical protein
MNITIILTCTVHVKHPIDCIHQTDKNERLEVYLKSIIQWLYKTNFNVIVVENSGYTFDELINEKELFKNRFEVITFKENELDEASYLINDSSKGASEMFAINYAVRNSKTIQPTNFIIKITARYFISELEEYLNNVELDKYDCLTQQDRNRCEMVGCQYKNIASIFDKDINSDCFIGGVKGPVEYSCINRTSKYSSILICKEFGIEKTQRGGWDCCYYTI